MLRFILILLLFPICALAEDVSILGAIDGSRRCLANFCFPETTTIASTSVELRNLKKERYFFFDLYVAAFYISEDVNGIDQVLGDVPKKLVFRYLRDFTPEQLIENADRILADNPEVDLGALKSELEMINKGYENGVKKGDVYELEYEPGVGTTLIRNRVKFCTIQGLNFAKAYFGIWLSKHPLSEELRDTLINRSR